MHHHFLVFHEVMDQHHTSPFYKNLTAASTPENGRVWEYNAERGAKVDIDWPKITIVTVSYNQGKFLEETVQSVLHQGYPNLEYIIIDGGSTDESVEIIKKYSPYLSYWVSEKDRGQTEALNKGFAKATGFIRGFLNSDDVLLPGALFTIATLVLDHKPHNDRLLIMGNCLMGYSMEEVFTTCEPILPANYKAAASVFGLCPQPATFWTVPSAQALLFNEMLDFCMDYDFWCRLLLMDYQAIRLEQTVAFYRHHKDAKGARSIKTMWLELAMLPINSIKYFDNFREKLQLLQVSNKRINHLLRLEIEEEYWKGNYRKALRMLGQVVANKPAFLFERPSLGLIRKMLLASK